MTDTPPASTKIDPMVERDNAFYWEAAKRGELVARACDACGHIEHPPVPMCPKCHGLTWSETRLSGRGVVKGWIKVHYPPTPFFDYPVPVVVVELEEGLQIVSNLVDADGADPQTGMPVEVAFRPTRSGWAAPVFRPRQTPAA